MGINIKSVQAYLIGLSLPLTSEEIFLKNKLDREIDASCEKFQKNKKNAQKTLLFSAAIWIAFLAWKTLKFGFLYFLEKL